MFPLVHYFVNSKILKNTSHLTVLGGLFPDLARSVGFDRNEAHIMGADFHAWCPKEAIALALGIVAHGSKPPAVDYYADEFWPGYKKGWCFMIGEKYMRRVQSATHLPDNLIWWKSHNFVEMACELITEHRDPLLKTKIKAAICDKEAIETAANLLGEYCHIEPKKISQVFSQVPQIFAIDNISALTLAQKQAAAFPRLHGVTDADIPAMAELIELIAQDITPLYDDFFAEVISKTALVLADY